MLWWPSEDLCSRTSQLRLLTCETSQNGLLCEVFLTLLLKVYRVRYTRMFQMEKIAVLLSNWSLSGVLLYVMNFEMVSLRGI